MPDTNPTQLPFKEAIEYFADKIDIDTNSWLEGQGSIQDVAFTVAGAKGQILQEIRNAADAAINEGISIAEFSKRFDTIADSYVDNWQLKGDRAWRSQLIYEMSVRQSFKAGRYKQLTESSTVKSRPYWQVRHGNSRIPRPTHLALDGKVFPADKLPFWPHGFGCLCNVFSLSDRDLKRENLEVSNLQRGDEIEVVDPKTGQRIATRLEPDIGFDYLPGKQPREEILKKLDPDIRKLVERESEAEFKLPEGKTKVVDGKTYVLKNSRWHLQQTSDEQIDRHMQELDRMRDATPKEAALNLADRLLDEADRQTDPIARQRLVDAALAEVETSKAAESEALATMGRLRSTLIDTGITADRARQLAGTIDTSTLDPSTSKQVQTEAAEYLRLTNGVGVANLESFKLTEERAYASKTARYINIGDGSRETIWHELGHFSEFETGAAANTDWIRERATDQPRQLSKLTGNSGYPPNELAYPDRFIDPYVGKWYPGGITTEVFSVGIEHFTSPGAMLKLWQKDPGHFDLIINRLKEWRSVPNKN